MPLFKFLKFSACLFATAFFLLVFGFGVNAGFVSYFNIYSFDAKLQSANEIEINSEIEIIFNQPVIFLKPENITFNPPIDFSFDLQNNGKLLIIKHSQSFSAETKYEIALRNIRGISGMLLKNKELIFYTPAEADNNSKIITNGVISPFTQLGLSIDKYFPPESSIPKDGIVIEPKIKEGKYIDISISNQVMTLFENGIKINSFLVSTGKYGMPTPLGTFSVKNKRRNIWSVYGLWMPYSLNFYGPYFIHELPYWPNGYREGTNHLGMRVSHGCVRLGIGPAEYVYNWSEIGTPVFVH